MRFTNFSRLANAALVLGLVASSCTSTTSDSIGQANRSPDVGSDSTVDRSEIDGDGEIEPDVAEVAEPNRDIDYLFDQAKLHTFELDLTEADLAEIDGDPTAEEYVPGTLTFEGTTISVGIRYKGSVGAFVGCLDGPNVFLPSGAKTCTKLSMKIKINWENGNDEFLGVRKLQFHTMNLDPSQLRERLGYWLFREMGVPSPRSTHARVVVNDEFVGLFALTENIDGRFTRANFGNGTGNLYKEAWPLTPAGRPQPPAVLLDSLRTNEDENPSAKRMLDFATEVAEAGDPETTAEVVERWMDVETLMAQLAVDRTIRHDDGPFHWYCVGDCTPHNFFFYEDPVQDRVHLIPWDIDNAFENLGAQPNPVTPVANAFGEITAECRPFAFGALQILQRSAACDPLFAAWATLDTEFEDAVKRLHEGPLRAEVVDPLLDTWIAQIQEATVEASLNNDDAISVELWKAAIADLRDQLDKTRQEPPIVVQPLSAETGGS